MGGFGSGYQGPRKPLVEDCLTLSISDLMRKGAMIPGNLNRGKVSWNLTGEEPHASIGFVADMRTVEDACLQLFYTAGQLQVDYLVKLTTTRPNFGGIRWWFNCPLIGIDSQADRRVAKLHLPPGERYFGSRKAHGLTYRSCRESGKFRALYAGLARNLGVDPAMLRRAVEEL